MGSSVPEVGSAVAGIRVSDEAANARLRELAFQGSPSPMVVLELTPSDDGMGMGPILDCSESFEQLVGMDRQEIVGQDLSGFLHPTDISVLERGLRGLLDPTRKPQVRIVRQGWGVVWVALAASVIDDPRLGRRLVVTLDDVTAFRRTEQALSHRASHDPLTGLPNRAVLMQHLSRVLARLGRRPGTVAVLFVDLDSFKSINDTYGHRRGDTVLQEVARRISLAVRRDDIVTRMGGDEFVVVCDSLDSASESVTVAERIRVSMEEPFELHGRAHTLSGSVGIAQTSDPSGTAEDLLRRADLAMYRAKERGRNRIEFFAANLEEQVRGRMRMVELLRSALDEDRITIDLQPVVRLNDSSIVGYEAFGRIMMPDGSVLHPSSFVDAAERSGLSVRLDTRILELGLAWLSGRKEADFGAWLGVNVSPRQLADASYPQFIRGRLSARELDPKDLVLEFGEPSMMDAPGPALLTLRRVRAQGVRIAVDEFGTGMSSLTAMRELPLDYIKLDGSFVDGLGRDPADETIVTAVISVAHDLGREVIAEGVTDPVQAEFLRSRGCDLGQGHLFGSPVRVGNL
ncbi:MAG: EAL domain-containing protein [Candidatus Nanopelagicales bacterium]|nr:EAL domain-containing protein [Candidatus Nanopelagicales bacterium]MDZ4250435.1 EAL domain-containing protein [Candidatus Nanopelagicales bacterium]